MKNALLKLAFKIAARYNYTLIKNELPVALGKELMLVSWVSAVISSDMRGEKHIELTGRFDMAKIFKED